MLSRGAQLCCVTEKIRGPAELLSERKSCLELQKPMALLPPDAWVLVGLHLKPRHLSKLIQTSKTVKKLVDTNAYWTRVAAHEVWSSFEGMEINETPHDGDVLPRIEHNLKYMLGLEHGYYWGMERFFQRVDEVIEYNSLHDLEEYRESWVSMKSMSLEEKTRDWMATMLVSYGKKLTAEEMAMSMKEIAKVEIEASKADSDPRFNRFVCSMDDDPMPPVYKRAFFRKLDDLLWSSMRRPQGDSTGNLQWGCCHAAIALSICKF